VRPAEDLAGCLVARIGCGVRQVEVERVDGAELVDDAEDVRERHRQMRAVDLGAELRTGALVCRSPCLRDARGGRSRRVGVRAHEWLEILQDVDGERAIELGVQPGSGIGRGSLRLRCFVVRSADLVVQRGDRRRALLLRGLLCGSDCSGTLGENL
jgi:hypothetical protein